MAKVHIYRNYRFLDKDPIIDAVRTVVKSEEHLKNNHVHQISGVATATLDNWFEGTTRKPQNATICQVTGALGYVRRDDLDKDGKVIVGFRKARAYDWEKEIEKQADFFLKTHGPKKKKKPKKRNGNGNTSTS
jgi:hypothetical protein